MVGGGHSTTSTALRKSFWFSVSDLVGKMGWRNLVAVLGSVWGVEEEMITFSLEGQNGF
jgi:hypothetical protein